MKTTNLLRILLFAAMVLAVQTLYAEISYDFQPTRIYDDENQPNDEGDFIGAYTGSYLDFNEKVFVNQEKINQIRVFELEYYEITDELRIEFGNNSDDRLYFLVFSDRTLSGGYGAAVHYTIVFPEGLFGDEQWNASGYTSGRANPEIKYTSGGYRDIFIQPEIPDGEWKIVWPNSDLELWLYSSNKSYDDIAYYGELDQVDNNGFYIDFTQPNVDWTEVKAGCFTANEIFSVELTEQSDGNFMWTADGGTRSGNQQPLITIGDYDYITDFFISVYWDGYYPHILIEGTGHYESTPIPEYVNLSISLPGGNIRESVPVNSAKEVFILPEPGWKVSNCWLNNEEISFKIDGDGKLTLNLVEDSNLNVVFEKDNSGVCSPVSYSCRFLPRSWGIEIIGKGPNDIIEVYTLDGSVAYVGNDSAVSLCPGIYIVKINGHSYKINTRI